VNTSWPSNGLSVPSGRSRWYTSNTSSLRPTSPWTQQRSRQWRHGRAPRTLRELRGFLDLTEYYRKFIVGYSEVAAPLTALLKKEAFRWPNATKEAFLQLKQALMTTPLLQMPNFSKLFIVDYDASGVGFGAVLHRGDGAITFSVGLWRPTTRSSRRTSVNSSGSSKLSKIGDPTFGVAPSECVRIITVSSSSSTNDSTIPKHTWVSKLFCYDFTVEYRPGKLNGAVEALSRREEVDAAVQSMSAPSFELFDTLRAEVATDPQVAQLRDQLAAGTAREGWAETEGLLLFQGKFFIPNASGMWPHLLADAHETGHEGVEKTLHRWRSSYIPQANQHVR
jgi:hypothetical protein